jgi:hypothetical protein
VRSVGISVESPKFLQQVKLCGNYVRSTLLRKLSRLLTSDNSVDDSDTIHMKPRVILYTRLSENGHYR